MSYLTSPYLAVSIKKFSISILVTVTLVTTGCSSFNNDFSDDIERQIRLQNAERDQLNQPNPDKEIKSAEFYEKLGDKYLGRGDINQAYIQYIKGLNLEPENKSLLTKQAELLLEKKQYKIAETIYNRLLETNQNDARLFEGLGRSYFARGNLHMAEQLFQKAIGLDNSCWKSHEFLGLINCSREEYEQAIRQYNQALALQPDDEAIINNLAVTYYLTGDYKKAVNIFESIAARSKKRKVSNNLALAYFQLGRYSDALEWFKRGSDQDAIAYNHMGYNFLIHKKYQEAIVSFQKAIELFPRYYPAAQDNLKIAQNALSQSVHD